ncbi:hypothetical protein [Escherichia coli]
MQKLPLKEKCLTATANYHPVRHCCK